MSDWLDAEKRVERAQQLSESQRWAEALAELDAAVAINPENALWHAQRGFLLEELNRPVEATGAYERSLEIEPGDRDVAMALGAALARQGRHANALTVFENIARQHSDFEPAYCHRIFVYAQLGRHDQAEEMFYRAQEIDEDCPHCFYYMGESLSMRSLTDRALFCWQKVLDLDPEYVGVNHHIAEAMRIKGDLQSAREYLLRELRNDPGNTDLLLDLADLALQSGDKDGAVTKLEQVIELEPRHAEAYYQLACIQLEQERVAKALTSFEVALSLADGRTEFPNFDARYGETLLRSGKPEDAKARLERALRRDANDHRAMFLLAECLLSLKKPEEAANCCRRALALDDRNGCLHHQLSICLLHMKKYEGSLEHALRAVELDPALTDALFHSAIAAVRLRRWGFAKTQLRTLLQAEPNHQPALSLLKGLWRIRFAAMFRRK
ncbi:MAG: tetratricopeptide repeat protein [Planctomycetes bacterium]|nr:tetratricopeptide repeat protein [Planctomycetota bacterium]